MKVSIAIKAEPAVEVSWPDAVPLPESGDSVVLKANGRVIEFVVDDRLFTVEERGASGPSILIRGHIQPAGAV